MNNSNNACLKTEECNSVSSVYRFSAQNTSLSTLSGFSRARSCVEICPALLKSLSGGEITLGKILPTFGLLKLIPS